MKIFSRKFILTLFICAISVLFALTDKITGMEALSLISANAGLYLGANVFQKIKTK
jgi:hypothetical protein